MLDGLSSSCCVSSFGFSVESSVEPEDGGGPVMISTPLGHWPV